MVGYCNTCNKQVEFNLDPVTGKNLCNLCGNMIKIPSVSQLNPGTVINGFLVEGRLGQGGMGVVYKAKQMNLERYVALKVLSDELSRDGEFVERFFKEARAAASLSHSNIVQVYDAGTTLDGIYYFAMELVEGETLDTRITREGILPAKDTLDICLKIASALDYAWERQKLCHGDIKPDNIILNSSGGAKLADLGLAKSLHDEKAFKDGLMATPLYAPPEIIAGDIHRIGCRSDMYSFGATMYHMLAGVPPFDGDDPEKIMKRHLNEKPLPLSQHNKEINSHLSNIVDHMLAKNPENRPSSWKEVCKSLEKIHDFERKIFHKGALPSAKPGQDHQQVEIEKKSDPLAKVVAILVTLVLLLALAAAGIFLYLEKKKKTAETDKPGQVAPASDIVAVEWQKIKAEVSRRDPEYGIELIQSFVKKHSTKIPAAILADADKILQELKQKVVATQDARKAREKKFQEIQGEAADLLKYLSNTDLPNEQKTKLEQTSKRIELVLDYVGKNKDLEFTKAGQDALNMGFLKISDVLQKIRFEEEKKLREEQVKKENERLEKERRLLAEEEKLRQEKLSANILIDGYYLALSEFEAYYQKKKEALYLKELLDKWLEDNKQRVIPEQLMAKAEFIKKNVVPSEPLLFSIFEKNEAALRGKPLPVVLPNIKDASEYMVDKVSDKSFKIMTSMGKGGKIGKSVSWDQFTNEMIVQLLSQRILNSDSGVKLGKGELSIILTFYVLNGMPQPFAELLKGAGAAYSLQERKSWETVMSDFQKASEERKAIELWKEYSSLNSSGKLQEASQPLVEIINNCRNTDFYRRYSDEMAIQLSLLKSYLPELQAIIFLDAAEKDIKNNNHVDALSKVMAAYARCGSMKNLKQSVKAQIQSMQSRCLSSMSAASSIKNISDNRIPFYYWESEVPGDSWIYEQVVKRSGKITRDKLISSMEIASMADMGCWYQALQISSSGKKLSTEELISIKGNLAFWSPSFIFANGLVDMQYNSSESQAASLAGLKEIYENFKKNPMEPMDMLTLNLAIEYALMLHLPVKAYDLASDYQFKMQKPDREIRIALLHILSSLQREDLKDEYRKKLKKYSEQFSQYQESGNDFNWCRMGEWILNEKRTLDPKRIEFLKESKCIAPDITARILSAAVAKSYVSGPGFNSDREIIPFLESKVSGNIVSGELWKNVSTLKLARSRSNVEMLKQTNELLDDSRFCAISFYPKLCMLGKGLEVSMEKITQKEASKRLSLLLESSGVSSDSDKKSIDVILSERPGDIVASLSSENRHVSAFWCAILGILSHEKDGNKVAEIRNALKTSIPMLTWEERLLLKSLSD